MGIETNIKALESENKSLRASLEDLQKAIEEIGNKEWVQGSSVKLICTKTLERLKARGHWVEEKK